MDAQTKRVVDQAEEALRQAAQEPDDDKAVALLDKAAKRLVALGRPPQDVLQRVRDAMKARSAKQTGATAKGPKKGAKAPALGYHPPPKTLPGFPNAKPAKPKTPMGGGKKRKRWKNDDGDILEWDYQHGKIERYNDKGKHKGEYDPNTGNQTKPADKTRSITPTISRSMKGKMVYFLTWFAKEGDEYMGEALLPDVSEANVRSVFGLGLEEPPGDCLEVEQEHVEWLSEAAKGVQVSLDLFEYFVEARQP
jgi:hypothetical protein